MWTVWGGLRWKEASKLNHWGWGLVRGTEGCVYLTELRAPEEKEVGSKHLPEKEAKMDKRPGQESILSVCKPSHEWL